MKHLILLLILSTFVINYSSVAQAQERCWTQELDLESGSRFAESHWKTLLSEWEASEPPHPSLLELFFGSIIADSSKQEAERMGNDERAHCLIGCRIAKYVDFETAVYAGWYKEKKDLTDCKRSTYFDPVDNDITLIGAELGLARPNCIRKCKRLFPLD